jgi:hypothetical protein
VEEEDGRSQKEIRRKKLSLSLFCCECGRGFVFLAQFWFPGGLLSPPPPPPLLFLLVPVHTRNSTLAVFLPSFNILCTPLLSLLHLVFVWESNSLLISRFGSYFLVVLAKRSFLSYLVFVCLSLSRCNRSVSKNCISFPVQRICCDSFHCICHWRQIHSIFIFLLPLSLSLSAGYELLFFSPSLSLSAVCSRSLGLRRRLCIRRWDWTAGIVHRVFDLRTKKGKWAGKSKSFSATL